MSSNSPSNVFHITMIFSSIWTFVPLLILLNTSNQLDSDTVTSVLEDTTNNDFLDNILNEIRSSLESKVFEKIGSNLDSETIEAIAQSLELPNEEKYMSGLELLTKYGYNFEEYTLETCDGYLLNIVRLPGNGQVVLLVHGLVFSYEDYITPGPDHGLAYLLVKAGYDVWMLNCRGNTFSRKHVTRDPKNFDFWDFSWHEIGTIDLSVTIDFVISKTGQTQLIYIGHSQATTAVLVLLSECPEYNSKLKLVILLSPVAFMDKLESPLIQAVAPFNEIEYFVANALGAYEFLPDNDFIKLVQEVMCPINLVTNYVCSSIVFLIYGFDFAQINVTQFPVEYFHVPSGAATKQVIHYFQEVESGEFRQFDYGEEQNLKRYNSTSPPRYNLSQITAPLALYYGANDWLSNVDNVQQLREKLPNVVEYYLVPFDKFNHIDFVWAKDVISLLYMRVFELIAKYD